jgi:CheY-like chemotaxis protein
MWRFCESASSVKPVFAIFTGCGITYADGDGGAPVTAAIRSEGDERTRLSGLKFLVVDDEEDAREIVAAILSGDGGAVKTAASVSEGLEVLPDFRPDILISDIGMPGEDGYSFIAKVRQLPDERGGTTPAIALTAYIRPEDRRKALNAGFDAHLGKPLDLSLLLSTISSLAR